MTYRELLQGLIDRTKRPQKLKEYEAELSCPELPPALDYLWKIYRRLRRRTGNGFGLTPIEWPAIDAFLRHAGISLAPWEIEVIEEVDDLFLIANAPKPSAPSGKSES